MMTINHMKHSRKFGDMDLEDISIPLIKRLKLDEDSGNKDKDVGETTSTTWPDEVCQFRLSKLRISKQKRSAENSIDSPTGSLPTKKLSRFVENESDVDANDEKGQDLTETLENDSTDPNRCLSSMNELLRELHFLRLERLSEKTRIKESNKVS